MHIEEAQQDFRHSYFGGAPGVLVSALAWFTAGLVSIYQSPRQAVITLLVGGMLIHPLSTLLVKALGRSAKPAAGNPMTRLALESTAWLIFCIPLAYALSRHRIEWFFPAMLLVIGGRYMVFATLYGRRIYWLCGGTLALAAYALAVAGASPSTGALTGAAIEAIFAAAIFLRSRGAASGSMCRPAGSR